MPQVAEKERKMCHLNFQYRCTVLQQDRRLHPSVKKRKKVLKPESEIQLNFGICLMVRATVFYGKVER